jgi:hypothetical protein
VSIERLAPKRGLDEIGRNVQRQAEVSAQSRDPRQHSARRLAEPSSFCDALLLTGLQGFQTREP